jgi:3-methylfumaryl-CoA hydratase
MSPSLSITPELLTHLQTWIGRQEHLLDNVTSAPVQGLAATLDLKHECTAGSSLPPLWHWLYFLPRHPQSELGADGHARLGGFLPPVPLPRRMWAGGQFEWNTDNPLRIGDAIARTSTIESVTHKQGKSGDLVFVRVRHDISNQHGTALTEHHDIVYRAAAAPSEPTPQPEAAERTAPWHQAITPDPVLLFRYSALTFNGHRIHYDRSYVTGVEGYPGLIVHGPLIATLLIELVRKHQPAANIRKYEFRAVRPTFDVHPFSVHGVPADDGKSISLWAQDHEGWVTMKGRVELG